LSALVTSTATNIHCSSIYRDHCLDIFTGWYLLFENSVQVSCQTNTFVSLYKQLLVIAVSNSPITQKDSTTSDQIIRCKTRNGKLLKLENIQLAQKPQLRSFIQNALF